MIYYKSVDAEDEIRKALASQNITAYCQPLPAHYSLPHIEIHYAGGTEDQTIDRVLVALDARAELAGEALDYINDAIGRLKSIAREQTTALRYVTVNAKPVAVPDPVRPDLTMHRATIEAVLHQQKMEVINA